MRAQLRKRASGSISDPRLPSRVIVTSAIKVSNTRRLWEVLWPMLLSRLVLSRFGASYILIGKADIPFQSACVFVDRVKSICLVSKSDKSASRHASFCNFLLG